MGEFPVDRPPRGRHEDPLTPAAVKRAVLLLDLSAAVDLAELTEEQFAVFDLVVFGSCTIEEARQELGIARMTANDRLSAAYAKIRRAIRNDPAAKLLFDAFDIVPKS